MMKKSSILLAILLMLCLSLAGAGSVFAEGETGLKDGGVFFMRTAPPDAQYGEQTAAPTYQGEDGRTLLYGNDDDVYPMFPDGEGGYTAGISAQAASVTDGYHFSPTETENILLRWRAPLGGAVTFSGMAYNYYSFGDQTDLNAAYGVSSRADAAGAAQGSAEIAVYFRAAGSEEYNILYDSGVLSDDFCLFVAENEYIVSAGDELYISVGGTGEGLKDVALYFGVALRPAVASYDFTDETDKDDFFVTDGTGNGNDMRMGYSYGVPTVNAEKGLYFNGGNPSTNFLFTPDYNEQADFTDTLADFSLHFQIILEEGDSWQYILSTTCGDAWQKGFAVRTEYMGADASAGYALKLCVNDGHAGDNSDFFFTNNGWITTLAVGNVYDVTVNISGSQHRAEMAVTGTFYNDWTGTARTGEIALADDWSMSNALNGLTIGAQNEAGQEGFKGWLRNLTIYPYNIGTGSSYISDSAAVESLSGEAAPVVWNADPAQMIADYAENGYTEVTLNLAGGGTAAGRAVWAEAVCNGGSYYLVGASTAAGYAGYVPVRAEVSAYVAQLYLDGRAIGYLSCSDDGTQTFAVEQADAFAAVGYGIDWYTDENGENAFDADQSVTADAVLFGISSLLHYSIEYNLNEGTNPSGAQESYTVTDVFTLPVPTRPGYAFEGWYTSANFAENTRIEQINGRTGDLVLYAKWEKLTYTISVADMENGSVQVAAGASYGEPVLIAAVPDDGYKLQSLTVTAEDGSTIVIDEDGTFLMPEQNVTITAIFEAAGTSQGGEAEPTGLGGGAIAGIVIACIVVVGIAIAVPLIVRKKKR